MKSLFERYSREQLYLALTDYLILVGTWALVMRLRFMPHIDIIRIKELHVIPQVWFMFFYAIPMLSLFQYDDLYKRKLWLSATWHMIEIFRVVYIAVVGYVLLQFVTKATCLVPNRSVILGWGTLASVVLILHRVVLFAPFLKEFWSKSRWRRRVVVIGASEVGIEFARMCVEGGSYHTLRVVGFLDDACSPATEVLPGVKCLGTTSELRSLTKDLRIEGGVITASDLSYQRLIELVEECASLFGWVDVHCDKASALQRNLNVDTYFETPFVRMGKVANTPLVTLYKRVTDIMGALVGLVVFSPIMLVAAVAVKLSSPGPAFYVTDRAGYKGKAFKFLKFRSMKVGADQDPSRHAAMTDYIRNEDNLTDKLVNEDYITGVGRFLRRYALDELPQLINVLKGDMSLIGPRPLPVWEYEISDDWQKRRYEIKPGCTGLWKLYRHQGVPARFSEVALYDIYYARNMGPLLDLDILLGTVRIVLSGKADV